MKVLPVVVYLLKSILKDTILNTSQAEKSLILRDLEVHLHVLSNHSKSLHDTLLHTVCWASCPRARN